MPEIFVTLSAALADRYTLERELGRGGMATVYLARDVRHARQVAIKVLHPELAAVLGAERFLAEIKTTANLQHPHILPLFDSGAADGQLFYVMPFVEGETLRARLERETQLPIADAVQLAREVADALQHAHERGVIHRDIKPENILLAGGHALVADFGIALAVQQAGGQRMTQTGLSLGTPQYMAPEQAMGDKAVDGRADIYALGAVTFEMLAGEPPFTGPTAQAIMARVLTTGAPALGTLRKSVPLHIADAVQHALEKLPADRFADARSYAAALIDTSGRKTESFTSAGAGSAPRSRLRDPVFLAVTALALVMGVGGAFFALGQRNPGDARVTAAVLPLEIRWPTNLPFNEIGPPVSIAPDGSFIVYVGADPDVRGATALWRRSLDQLSATVIPGTRNAQRPEISADARSVYFLARADDRVRNVVRIVPLEGGVSREVLQPSRYARLLRDGSFALTDTVTRGITLVEASPRSDTLSGASNAFTTLVRVSPDRTHSTTGGGVLRGDSMFVSHVGKPGRAYIGKGLSPRFLDQSTLVYRALDGPLMVGRLNSERTAFLAPPIAMTGTVTLSPIGHPIFDLADDGTLIYASGGDATASKLVWVGRDGAEAALRDSESRQYQSVALSPEGRRVATSIGRSGPWNGDVWVQELASASRVPISTDGHSGRPVWSVDGRRLAYIRSRAGLSGGGIAVMQRSATADAPEDSMPGPWPKDYLIGEFQWSADGRSSAVRTRRRVPGSSRDLLVRVAPGSPFRPFAADSGVQERNPRFSPDGRWIAFASDRSSRDEVYVDAFPGGGARLAISVDGASEPVWSRDGSTLFYRDLDGWMVAATVTRGTTTLVTRRERLFDASAYVGNQFLVMYDVAPDGRFLMLKRDQQALRTDIVIVRNWVRQAMARLDTTARGASR